MREIKFRAWHEYGNTDTTPMSPGMIYDDKPGDCLTWKNQGQKIVAIMQYTGLKDRHDKAIYEGDILIFKEGGYTEQCFVVYADALFWNRYKNRVCELYLEHEDCEIIGNIYDNPELAPKEAV